MIRNTHSRLRVLRWRGLGGHIDQKYSLQAEGFTVEGVGGVTLIRNTHSRLRVLRWRGLGVTLIRNTHSRLRVLRWRGGGSH